MKISRIPILIIGLSLTLTTPAAFAKGNGGGGGSSGSGSGGGGNVGGGGGGGRQGSGGISHGSAGGGVSHFSSAPRYYSARNWTARQYYHPTTTYGTGVAGSRRLSYPAVRGSAVVHHSALNGVNRTARVHASTSLHNHSAVSPQNGRSARHRATTSNYANTGKWSHSNRKGRSTLDPQTSARLRNWNGKRDNFAQARWKHEENCRHHHGRDWWRNHCAAIIFFDWGFWAWDAGWWYPAWGYDPYYSYYEYNEPIYGYDGLPPDQVVANVQGALQQLGYYRDAVDGVIGPVTRAAIANYQRDHGLPITSAIDESLLASLGFIAQ